MEYTIGQVAKKMAISTYTLRYYDKEGLLPFVKRNLQGVRVFDESDLDFLHVIYCLKNTGMSINDIRTFIGWAKAGDESIGQRYEMFKERKKAVDQQIAKLKEYRNCIEYKCNYYKQALEASTEQIHNNTNKSTAQMPLRKIVKLSR